MLTASKPKSQKKSFQVRMMVLMISRQKLGWCIVGAISDGSYQNRFHCNRIMVKDHATGNISNYFAIPEDVKKDGIRDLLKKLYTADFMENQILPGFPRVSEHFINQKIYIHLQIYLHLGHE